MASSSYKKWESFGGEIETWRILENFRSSNCEKEELTEELL